MDDNILLYYSEFFNDDGGFKKVLADFDVLGERLVSQAQKYKSEINAAFNSLNIDALKNLELQIESNAAKFKELNVAKASLIKVEKEYLEQLKRTEQVEQQVEKTKQAKLQTTKKEIEAERELDRAIQQENNTKKSAISLSEAERRARESAQATINKQKGAYAEMSAELRKLFTASANVATEMFKLEQVGKTTTPEYRKLANQFTDLQKKTLTLDAGLKKIDSSLGRNFRNVGDYASGYNGLNNSVNQLTRELPAFAVSASTGFLAISNNLPIFFDELQRVTEAVKQSTLEAKINARVAFEQAEAQAIAAGATKKAAAAQGALAAETVLANAAQQKSLSVGAQLFKSIFSLQTLLSTGVVLLTVYGGKIVKLIADFFDFADATEYLTERQEAFLKATVEGTKASFDENLALKQNLAVAKNKKLSDEERLIAVKNLVDAYPFYFKGLTTEQILAGQTAKAEDALRVAIEKRSQANKLSEEVVVNKKKIKDLDDELAKQRKIAAESAKIRERTDNYDDVAFRKALDAELAAEKEIVKSTELRTALVFENAFQENKIVKLRSESIGLDYKEVKSKEARTKAQINYVDYLASEFELKKLILENTIKENEEIFGSEKFSLEKRLDAQKNLVVQSLALAQLEKKESLRVLRQKYDEERSETIKDSDGKIIGSKYTKKALLELEKQYNFDVQKVQEEFRDKQVQIGKKAEQVQLLARLDFQKQNLEYNRKFFSTTAKEYEAFSKQISAIQSKIDQIISQPEGLELTDKIQVNDAEIKRITEFRKRLDEEIAKNGNNISAKQRQKFVKELETFEKEKTDIETDAEVIRQLNRIKSIEEEQKSFVDTSNEFKALEIERQEILKKLEEDRIKKSLDDAKEANKKILDDYKAFVKELNRLIDAVIDRLIKLAQQRVDQDEKALDNQKRAIEIQQERAAQGLENTLAFEQRMQGKREAELIKSQKREQRLQKVKALYSSYAGYADKDPDTAVAKALRDFALLEAITASFGDGGIVGVDGVEKVRINQNGITQGRSHSSKGGVLAFHEGGEGFWSRKEVDAVGAKNFYKIKELAGSGKLDSNFFTPQKEAFVQTIGVPTADNNLIKEVKGLKQVMTEIKNKPVPKMDVEKIGKNMIDFINETEEGNKKTKDRYRFRKPRL